METLFPGHARGFSSGPAQEAHGCPLENAAPFRPVQYLGSKLRVLEEIASATASLVGRNARIGDLFTGTSVVAQALAGRGYTLSAIDAQSYAVVFASALLGVGRRVGERLDAPLVLSSELSKSVETRFSRWRKLAELEAAHLRSGDYGALKHLYANLPLIWRDANDPAYKLISDQPASSALDLPLITSIYAGTYFGVGQALEIDLLRHHAAKLRTAGALSDWQFNACLTAIMHAASAVVHSAGKHFAQPLVAGLSGNSRFLERRLLEDRNVSVNSKFVAASSEINARLNSERDHFAIQHEAEKFVQEVKVPHDLYYLDPPYTAQQYSRFYHVLETLVDYKYPQLVSAGHVTTGLYPTGRYKSAFSSKTKAVDSFSRIIRTAKKQGSSLLISYSESDKASNGNARMISLPELIRECRDSYGHRFVDFARMQHRYRQFNSTQNANNHRSDSEILITCKIH